MFQILALNCLVSAYGLSVLHLRGVRMGDTQATATGIATALFFLFVSGSRPLHRLSPRRPPASVLAPYVFFSVLAQFAVHLGLLMQALPSHHPQGSTWAGRRYRPRAAHWAVPSYHPNYLGRQAVASYHPISSTWAGRRYLVISLECVLVLTPSRDQCRRPG